MGCFGAFIFKRFPLERRALILFWKCLDTCNSNFELSIFKREHFTDIICVVRIVEMLFWGLLLFVGVCSFSKGHHLRYKLHSLHCVSSLCISIYDIHYTTHQYTQTQIGYLYIRSFLVLLVLFFVLHNFDWIGSTYFVPNPPNSIAQPCMSMTCS